MGILKKIKDLFKNENKKIDKTTKHVNVEEEEL